MNTLKQPADFWQSSFTREYGLDLPFIAAGMGFISTPPLVAAVSNAGGFGVLGAAPAPAPLMQEMIRQTRALTCQPFGVDLIIDSTQFGPCTTDEHIAVCIEERIPVVVFFWNPPPAQWLERLHRGGCKVWMQVGSVDQARAAVRAGIDAVIAQGSEAGGHNRSQVGMAVLVPAMVDALAPVPVLAAGGIADSRGVAAAFALGASAVWVGTRLVASHEAQAHAEYKRRIVEAGADDITRTTLFGPEWPDQPMRVIVNRAIRESGGQDNSLPAAGKTIGQSQLFGQNYSMPRFSALLPTVDTEGDFDEMCLAAGQSAGLINDIRPAAEIVEQLMTGAQQLIESHLKPERSRR